MVELIGAGLPRTGTLTQKVALEMLGLAPCYHWVDVLAGLDSQVPLWEGALEGRVEPASILEGWRSTVDWPGGFFYRELVDAFPNAKVLLSVRDPERWEPSFRETIVDMCHGESLIRLLSSARAHVDPTWRRYLEFVDRMFWSEQGTFPAGHSPEALMEAFVAPQRGGQASRPGRPAARVGGLGGLGAAVRVSRRAGPVRAAPPRQRSSHVPRPRNRRRDHDARLMAGRPAAGSLSDLPRISGLAVVEPTAMMSQREVLSLLGLEGDSFAEGVFGRAAVASRSLGLCPATVAQTLQGRTAWTEEQLFEAAVDAVRRLDVAPAEIGTVVTSSLYSLGGPTLAHRLVERFGMDPSTDKYHVVGVGCASAVPLVRLVTGSLDAHPGRKGLIVAAESMSGLLMRAAPGDHRAKTVGSAIFGDGCAAAVIERGTSGPAVAASKVHQIEGTLGAVRMELSDEDSYLHLDRDLPEVAACGLPRARRRVPRVGRASARRDRPLDHPPRRPPDPRSGPGRARAHARGGPGELRRARNARERRDAVDLLRAQRDDLAAAAAARRTRADGHGRSRGDGWPDAARVLRPPAAGA